RVGDAAVERESGVIAEINAVVGVVRVGSAGADLNVPGKSLAAIGAEGAPDLGVVIGDAVGIARPPDAQLVARDVPAHVEVAAEGLSDEGAVIAEGRGAEAIGIDIDPDFAATGASLRGRAD